MKRLDHSNLSRDELVEYADKLESALFEIHNLFWFEIGEDGVVRPVARVPVGAEERLNAALSYSRYAVNSASGGDVFRIRTRRKLIGRKLVAIMSVAMTIIMFAYIVSDVLASYGIKIMGGEF